MKSLTRIAVTVAIVVAIFSLFWIAGGKAWVKGLISTEDWASFRIPDDPLALKAEFRVSPEGVTVCNKGSEPWSNLLIRIDRGYLAEVKTLETGACKEIPIEKFAKPSWKRLPAYRGLQITRVELLASVARQGYTQQEFSTESKAKY